jgi:hypothetical protein
MMEHMKDTVHTEWTVVNLGEPTKIVGIEVTCSNEGITILQEKYIENVLKKHEMVDTNPVGTPMDPNVKLEPNPEDNELNHSNAYARLLGELQFIANSTQPDIAYAVNKLAAYTTNPSVQHYTALKWILRYLAGTKTLGITY